MKQDINLINTRWDLSPLYESINDPKITKDINEVEKICKAFPKKYKDHLDTNLENALKDFILIDEITSSIFAFFYLNSSRDAENEEIKKQTSIANERISIALANLSFFDIELGKLDKQYYDQQVKSSKLLLKNKPHMDMIRKFSKYQLSENVETILTKISPFLSNEWDDLLEEAETKLKFKMGFKTYNFSEILHIANNSPKSKFRKKALDLLNAELKNSNYQSLRTRALNIVLGQKNLMDTERGLKHIMEARNLENNLDDKTVNALHESVLKYGKQQGKRYYNILKNLLGKKVLNWSDRNAMIPLKSETYYKWDDCKDIVLSAYNSFSPKLANLIKDSFKNNRVDAPVYNGKTSGAYNYTVVSKGGKVSTWTFLNYMGTTRDVMTLAHELGHSVHGLLAGNKQGSLQAQAPMAYAETASIFGEMLTFEYMISKITDKQEKLVLLLNKANDWINSVNRQISFSLFEQIIHEKRKNGKLTTKDFNDAWLQVTKDMYGEEGEIFTYKNIENLWCYVSHFMRPFYVYSYAFGELFTQSLFAIKSNNLKNFEKLYIEMLESGSTKNAIQLMKPFGLNPTDTNFWENGINVSIKKWLDEAEILIKELKL